MAPWYRVARSAMQGKLSHPLRVGRVTFSHRVSAIRLHLVVVKIV